jgi:L-ascorbate metabolism protein UlaG (beta-lactamase superfamily)
MSITVQWLGHASFKITAGATIIYIDPWKLGEAPRDGAFVLVSHSHYDHCSAEDIEKIAQPETVLIGSADVVKQHGAGESLAPGEVIEKGPLKVTGVAAYNPEKQFHPKANNWLGFVVEIDGKRIYYAGDTDVIEEMSSLKNIDLALLPVGGTYTMDSEEAARAADIFRPARAIPYHWGDIVGARMDAEVFFQNASCEVELLNPGEAITL